MVDRWRNFENMILSLSEVPRPDCVPSQKRGRRQGGRSPWWITLGVTWWVYTKCWPDFIEGPFHCADKLLVNGATMCNHAQRVTSLIKHNQSRLGCWDSVCSLRAQPTKHSFTLLYSLERVRAKRIRVNCLSLLLTLHVLFMRCLLATYKASIIDERDAAAWTVRLLKPVKPSWHVQTYGQNKLQFMCFIDDKNKNP